MSRAVILGSGGVTGGAWQIGVLKGLWEAGFEPTRADLFVGSSVGAVLACQIQAGQSIGDLYAARTGVPAPIPPAAGSPDHDQSVADRRYFQDCLQLWRKAREDITVRLELGKRALATPHPIPKAAQVVQVKQRLALNGWPSRLVKVAAVDVSDGTVRFFDGSQGVPIEVAVAASCAQPGLQAPVSIGDRRYMDGGIGGTNIDGASGYRLVLAITAFPAGQRTREEIAVVQASGAQVVHLAPDGASQQAMGPDLSDIRRARPAAEAGARQAADIASTLRTLWNQ